MFKHKSKYFSTHTHRQPNINTVLISVCLLLIQRANRRLCVLLSAKPVYAASDLWGCCMQPKQRLWPLFPQFSPPLSISRHWLENILNSWCSRGRPVSNSVCKNPLEVSLAYSVLEGQDFMHTTTQTEPESLGEFKTIYNAFLLLSYQTKPLFC